MDKQVEKMRKTENINLEKVEEMAEGDIDFRNELLRAMYISIQDLKTKYTEGVSTQNLEILQQARHKIKPSLSLFELNKLNAIILEGKAKVVSVGFKHLEDHQRKFEEVVDDLLSDLKRVIKD